MVKPLEQKELTPKSTGVLDMTSKEEILALLFKSSKKIEVHKAFEEIRRYLHQGI